jgi:hypothetical protein
MSEYEEPDMDNDPDKKQFFALKEQMELWRIRSCDEELTQQERDHAENKYIDLLKVAYDALKRFNDRWDKELGPLPELDMETLQSVRERMANDGMEVTIDELRELLNEEDF